MLSFIRKFIDSFKVRKADKLIAKGNFAQGEAIYLDLVSRSASAVAKLAQYYHNSGLYDKALSLFDQRLEAAADRSILFDATKFINDTDLKSRLGQHILSAHKKYLSDPELRKWYYDWYDTAFDSGKSIEFWDKLNSLGYDVEELYVRKVHSQHTAVSNDQWFRYLERLHELYPESKQVIDDILTCARAYEKQKRHDAVVNVTKLILASRDHARHMHSIALHAIACSEDDIDKKISLLDSALSVLAPISGAHVDNIRESIYSTYHEAGSMLYSCGRIDKSYEVFHFLAQKEYANAVHSIATYRFDEVKDLDDDAYMVKATSAVIEELNQYKEVVSLASIRSYVDLWRVRSAAVVNLSKALNDIQADSELEHLLLDIRSQVWNSKIDESYISDDVVSELIRRKYSIAYEKERMSDSTVTAVYESIVGYEGHTESVALYRLNICRLKFSEGDESVQYYSEISPMLNGTACRYPDLLKDLAYRYVLSLLENYDYRTASSIISKFFSSDQQLIDACDHVAMLDGMARLNDFNEKLSLIREDKLSSEETMSFLRELHDYSEAVRPVFDIKGSELSRYRSQIKEYLVYRLFQEGRYDVAFERLLKENEDYLDELDVLRNIALVCLNMAESKQITRDNYREVIAVWLTSIYQVRLFVKSLDYTAWDDQFKFSLKDAYGLLNEMTAGELPENVNFDDSDDCAVVSIREVQRILLDRFEAAISDNQEYHLFFNQQKDAMDAFCALRPVSSCKVAAPFLADKDELVLKGIYDSLEYERQNSDQNYEDIVSVGASYGLSHPVYRRYAEAQEYYRACISAVDSKNIENVQSAYELSKVLVVKEFEKMTSALVSYLNNKVSSLSNDAPENSENNYNLYINICQTVQDSTLSFVYANYVLGWVISEVNGNKMSKAKAAAILVSIYGLAIDNDRVKTNLTTLFEMLCSDWSSENSQAINDILNVAEKLDLSYHAYLKSRHEELIIGSTLNGIVDDVNSSRITELDALKKIYNIYEENPNNERVCNNLVQISDICIMKYVINQSSGSTTVYRILRGLADNRSPVFQKCAHAFERSYDKVWNQLPIDSQMTLLYSSYNLNSAGKALNEGLNLYSMLGGFKPADTPGFRLPKTINSI